MSRIIDAITTLYDRDAELVDVGASERSMTHKLAEHLQKLLPEWHVDCEYNRRGREIKRLPSPLSGITVDPGDIEAATVFPDIIVHRRGTSSNLGVIEVKKRGGQANTRDREKIESFVHSDDYMYQNGFLLTIDHHLPDLEAYRPDVGWTDYSSELRNALAKLGHSCRRRVNRLVIVP